MKDALQRKWRAQVRAIEYLMGDRGWSSFPVGLRRIREKSRDLRFGCIRCPTRAIRFEPRQVSDDFGDSLASNSFSRNGSKSPPDGHPLPRGHLIWVICAYQKSLWAVLPQSPIYLLAPICAHMIQVHPPNCPFCCRPMKLSRTTSKTAFPLFLFHCRPCNHTTTKQQKPAQPAVCEPGRRGPRAID